MTNPTPEGDLAPVLRLDDYRSANPPEPLAEPNKVWAEVMAAAQLFGTLRQAGMSVRFDTDDEGPPRVSITDLQGNTIKEIPPGAACDPQALEDAAFEGPA